LHIDIEYFGHSAFLVSADDGTKLLTDPFQKTFSYPDISTVNPDIITISHLHQGHNNFASFTNNPAVIMGEGLRKIGWIEINGIHSFHDQHGGEIRGLNTIFCWKMRSISFCHLGDLGDIPSNDVYEQLGTVDFLFVPTGGKSVLSPGQAEIVVNRIKPKFVIPMHFDDRYYQSEFTQDDFLNLQSDIIISPVVNKIRFKREEVTKAIGTKIIKLKIKGSENE